MSILKIFKLNIPYSILKTIEKKQETSKLANRLFWGFNSILFLILVLNELFWDLFIPLIRYLNQGHPFSGIMAYTIPLYLLPILAVFIGIKQKAKPALKLKTLFGIEIPILLLVIIRQGMLYELNISMKYLFILLFAFIAIYGLRVYFLFGKTNSKLRYILKLRKLLLYVLTLFFSALFIISTLPLGLILLKNTLHPALTVESGLMEYFFINLLILFLMILTFNAVFYALGYSLKNIKYSLLKMNIRSKISYLLPLIALFSALYFLNIDYRDYSYLELKKEPSLHKQKEMFFNNMGKLEREMRNSGTARYYYLGSVQNNFFCEILDSELNLNKKQEKLLQAFYNVFMYPFFFQDTYDVGYEARNIYEEFFDEPINEYPYYYDDYEFAHANVHIDKQEITIDEYDDIAEVEICESYNAKSGFAEEIRVSFALPYNSVITGLWISDHKNADKKYPGIVAPSGAARKVYLDEVRKRVDPALLSQISANEYLLRAFPILSERGLSQDASLDSLTKKNYQFSLWFSYKTFISDNNTWELPKLINKWNVNWSDETKTYINGKITNRPNNWLPEYVAATNPSPLKEHAATILDTLQIAAKPIAPQDKLSSDENIALIIDGSYSMNKNRGKLIEKIREIEEILPNYKEMDCFVVGRDITKLKAGQLQGELENNPQLFFGNTSYLNMLEDFTTYDTGYANKYSSIILLSDIYKYRYPANGIDWQYIDGERYADTLKPRQLDCPFIIVKLSEEGYNVNEDDFFNKMVYKSNGGFAKNKTELFNLLKINSRHAKNILAIRGNIAYSKSKALAPSDSLFKDFGTKEYINTYKLDDTTRLADIDLLNEMAEEAHIVTKYSSMIALVNQQQIDSLESAETQFDRYNNFREYNSSNGGVLGLMSTGYYSVPKYPENVVLLMFFLCLCIMVFADRFR